jgi:hypothetical protein
MCIVSHMMSHIVSPRKMTMRDAQLIEKLFFGRYSIGYLTRGTMKSYRPAR